ncbi:acyltransferase [Cribrihabitans pelagius]|uniref:acyltransferase n=1 Tax=Cribrihabitans pelagius TaxID=1765746 RepID=UPI003B5BBC1A
MAAIEDSGENNRVIGDHSSSPDLTVRFFGSNNTLTLGNSCRLSGHVDFYKDRGAVEYLGANRGRMMVYLKGDDCRLAMGYRSKCNASFFANLAENKCSVQIGDDCLFAGVKIRPSDSHTIFNLDDGERINEPRPIIIEEHVWISEEAIILGGSHIGSGSVIGARAVVNGPVPSNCLAVGTPAKVIRENIGWKE